MTTFWLIFISVVSCWLLAMGAVVLIACLPCIVHAVSHRMGYNKCAMIKWRRQPDGVLMIGFKCKHCHRIDRIHPSTRSYQHRVHL